MSPLQETIAIRHQRHTPLASIDCDCYCPCHAEGKREHCGSCCDVCPLCGRRIKRGRGNKYLPLHHEKEVTLADIVMNTIPPLCVGPRF